MMSKYEYKHWCGNCQIRIYIQRHEGRILTWQDCPYTCEYATAMRCSTEAKVENNGYNISRQAASECEYWDSESSFCSLHRPSAEKTGRWVAFNGKHFCSNCGNSFDVDTCMGTPMWNYCPNCGSLMGEVNDKR